MNEENAKQLIELIKAQSNVKIGQGVISGNTLSIDGVSGEIVGKCQGDNVLLRGEDGQWYGFIDSGEEETQVLSSKTIRNYKRQAPVDKDEVICFLIDVSNSIEMDGVNRCMTILNNQLEGQFKRLTNQKIIILPFADSVYTPNTIFGNTLTRQKAIVHLTAIVTGYDSLEDKFDRYDPSVFIYGSFGISESDPNKDTLLNAYKSFWINEGTDLPENGIDALNDAILSIDNKYLVNLYLVTDNSKYSRNTSDPEDILDLINNKINKINKLFIDIIEPENVPSEHIIEQGSETNPYCSNSAITTVLVNDVKIGNYPPSSIINKIDNYKLFVVNYKGFKVYKYVLKLIQHFVDVETGFEYDIIKFTRSYSAETPTSELFISKIDGVTYVLSSNTLWHHYGYATWTENQNPPSDLSTNEVMNNFLNSNRSRLNVNTFARSISTFGLFSSAMSYSFEVISKTEIASFDISHLFLFGTRPVCYNLTLYYSYPTKHKYQLIYRNQIKEDLNFDCIQGDNFLAFDKAFFRINFNKSKLNYTNSGNRVLIFYDNTIWYDQVYNDCTAEILEFESDKKTLKINNNFDIELQQSDVVKAICQPQIVPLIEPNSTLYTTSLPPSNKIIYLD